MYGWLKIVVGGIATALLVVSVWGCFGLAYHLIVAVDRFGDAGAGLAATTARLNGPHGTLAMTDEDIGTAKSMIIHADLVARHEQQQLSTYDADAARIVTDMHGVLASLKSAGDATTNTAQALTGTAQQATATLGEGQRTIAAAQPLLASYTASGNDLDALLKRQAIGQILDHAAGITGNADAILSDGKKVADKATADYLAPKPWYIKARNYAGDTYDLAALFARHTP